MKSSDITTKDSFERFCAKEFPNKKNCWTDDYCYIQAGIHMEQNLHYEFWNGHVRLHIEGPSSAWRGIRNYLNSRSPFAKLEPNHWYRQNCDWKLIDTVESEQQLFNSFKAIREILEPHIKDYEASLTRMEEKAEQDEKLQMKSSIVKVNELLTENLIIPHYQRPYRWGEKNVRQLLLDIFNNYTTKNKSRYRIGSVILHSENNNLDIVDGQQRITTISLILKACGIEVSSLQLKYNHSDSFQHIKSNYDFIKDWINDTLTSDLKDSFANYIQTKCEFVKIVVTERSEAFQMFDSQNGRGKELEAYNLLKAYHIRAMEQNSMDEKIRCDVRWEDAIQFDATPLISSDDNIDILKQIFEEQLYKSRIWTRRTEAGRFLKKNIDEFKGFTIDKNHQTNYPYQNPQLLQYLTAKFYHSTLEGTIATSNRFESGDSDNIDPFASINQTIVNGKSFFEYIETYVELYKRIFLNLGSHQLAEFKNFYYMYCLNYDCNPSDSELKRKESFAHFPKGDARRVGDGYLREIYKSLILSLFDKFGERGLNRYYKTLYKLVYSTRLEKSQVRFSTADKLPHEYFAIIHQARDLAGLRSLDKCRSQRLSTLNVTYNNIPKRVRNFITQNNNEPR